MTPAPATLDFQSRFAPAEASGEIGRLAGYSIRRLISSGGMGEVYEAVELALNRPVALKVMLGDIALKPEARARFLREARSAAAVVHDHIVRIYQVGEDRGLLYIAMELLRGQSLEEKIRTRKFEAGEVIRIASEACAGLAAAHNAGLIHRDIKPGNLWLEDGSGRLKILDFGLARSSGDHTLTNTGQVFGTPAYIAPEQASGRPTDHRADLFSLGCVIYELATGHRPFRGDNALAMLNSLANDTPLPPQQLNPKVPANLSNLILKLIQKDPIDRPASAEDALRMLERAGDATIMPLAMPVAAGEATLLETFLTSRLRGLLLEADLLCRKRDFLYPSVLHAVLSIVVIAIAVAVGVERAEYYEYDPFYKKSMTGISFSRFITFGLGTFIPLFLIGLVISRWYFARKYRQVCHRLRVEFPQETAHWGDEHSAVEYQVIKTLLQSTQHLHPPS